jgi:hypothetical protein
MKKILLLISVVLLSACGSAGLDDYKNTSPELKLEQFFDGKLKAYGMVFDRSGLLLRRFEGDKGEIKEWFVFDDGEKTTRIWQLVRESNNTYTGTASDIVGVATGRTQGSALFWQYQMNIDVDGSTYQISLDDWMYLMDDKRLFNKTDMTKFGFKVGEIILYIEKIDPQ